MGQIHTKRSIKLQKPRGWKPNEEQYNLPFIVEITPEDGVHIHWQDIRLEMDINDFEEYCIAIKNSYKRWIKKGRPKRGYIRVGWWPGEEGTDRKKDRKKQVNKLGKPNHHFRVFPRTESGHKYYDGETFQIELQKCGQLHIHYRNWRWELGIETFLKISKLVFDFAKDLETKRINNEKFKYWNK